jgi:3-methylfumaryl-CoA hydratase
MAFRPQSQQLDIGNDGHPKVDPRLGVSGFPQRMFAGGRVDFLGDARVGAKMQRTSRIGDVRQRSGRSGELTIVTIKHEIVLDGNVVVAEEQDVVYRKRSPLNISREVMNDPSDDPSWDWEIQLATSTTALFRYSALTYNAHRIHYDRDYARSEEGYPGLVVAGPYQATGAAEIVRRFLPDSRVSGFSFKAVRPVFDGSVLRVFGRRVEAAVVEAVCVDHYNQPTLVAEIRLKD